LFNMRYMKKINVILFLLFLQYSFGQSPMESMKFSKKYDVPINQNITINYSDYFVYINILPDDPEIKPKNDLYYYWYGANDVKRTKGGYSGKLLHGSYTEYYSNKNLKSQGRFKYGLKTGEWKSWHFSGEYDEICTWRKGKKHGVSRVYNDKGELIRESFYKNDELHGKTKVFNSGSIETIRYRHGKSYIKEKQKKSIIKLLRKPKKMPGDPKPVNKKIKSQA